MSRRTLLRGRERRAFQAEARRFEGGAQALLLNGPGALLVRANSQGTTGRAGEEDAASVYGYTGACLLNGSRRRYQTDVFAPGSTDVIPT
jgi:hypothetical protein